MLAFLGELALIGSVVAPLAAAALSVANPSTLGGGRREAVGLAWLSATMAVSAAVVVGLRGPFVVGVDATHGEVLVGLMADQLTVTLVALVCMVGAVVQSFSLRYLQGDTTARRFFAAANVVVASMAIVCSSATLALLICGWVTAGAAFVAVLGCRADLPGVRAATRRTARMFVIGDMALVVSLVLLWLRVGDVNLASPPALAYAASHLGSLATPIALLIALAVMTRSAQGLLGGWLPGTVAAPTPTSALLHAGVVNGGGILLLRLGVLAGSSMLVIAGLFIVATLTVAVATLAMRHRADVKGSLVFSTMGQMGFMIAECTVGAYLAAIVHLIGHALYKATLFFGSGSRVAREGQEPAAPSPQMPRLARTAAAGVSGAAAVAAMVAIPGVLAHRGAFVLVIFAAMTAGVASWSWWNSPPGSGRVAVFFLAALTAAGALYGLVLGGLGSWLAPSLPAVGVSVLNPWWLATLGAAGITATVLARLSWTKARLVAMILYISNPSAPHEASNVRNQENKRRTRDYGYVPVASDFWEKNAA